MITPYTPEDIQNAYEFKLAKKILKDQFPFILDIKPPDARYDIYHTIEIQIYVDFDKLAEYGQWNKTSYSMKLFTRFNNNIWQGAGFYHLPYSNATPKDGKEIEDDINDALKKIHNSPAIPSELKFTHSILMEVGRVFFVKVN